MVKQAAPTSKQQNGRWHPWRNPHRKPGDLNEKESRLLLHENKQPVLSSKSSRSGSVTVLSFVGQTVGIARWLQ